MKIKISSWLLEGGKKMQRFGFHCPGCHCMHYVDETWKFNNDVNKPTFHPSILVTYGDHPPADRPAVCHSFIENGMIRFCGDSKHALANQTVELIDL